MYFCTDKALFEKSKTEKSDEICKLANRNPTERNINVNYSTSAHNLVSSSFKEEIDIPLAERCRRVNEYKAGEAILVSIHCNAAGNGSDWMQARGWEAWTSVGQTKADKLATCLYEAAEKCLPGMKIRKDMTDGDPDKESGFYILKHTKCPAVLTENLFQDNKEDVDFLLSAKGKAMIIETHIIGIINYINTI